MKNEFTAFIAMQNRVQSSAWKVGKNFASRKPAVKKQTFTEYLKKRGIIAFKQSAGSV